MHEDSLFHLTESFCQHIIKISSAIDGSIASFQYGKGSCDVDIDQSAGNMVM